MNFLAHLYLSDNHPDIMLGNFLADFLTRRDYQQYPPMVQLGFELHHEIDHFTDHHPLVKESALLFKPQFGRYASVIIDIVFDHFLAAEWESLYRAIPYITLEEFSEKSYSALLQYPDKLPDSVQRFLPRMRTENWLVQYGRLEGLQRALWGISRRATFQHNLDEAVPIVEQHYTMLRANVQEFIPILYAHSIAYIGRNRSDS
jgi:acyl carrier protein phosphodiesterase